jgi:hypothetical protein
LSTKMIWRHLERRCDHKHWSRSKHRRRGVGQGIEGRIAGAGLDVVEDEPKVPAELLSMDNVVLSPHIAVFIVESRSDLYDNTISNLEAFFSGMPLLTPVLS